MNKHETHVIIQAIQEVASELGHAPSKREFTKHSKSIHHSSVVSRFKTWSAAVIAAGLVPNEETQKKKTAPPKLELVESPEQVQEIIRETAQRKIIRLNSYKKILCIPDFHAPFVNFDALSMVYAIAESEQPDTIVQLGDLFDCYSQSRFPRNVNIYTPKAEWDLARSVAEDMWKKLRELCPKATCLQILGNHCVRPLLRIAEKFPEGAHLMEDAVRKAYEFDGVTTIHNPSEELFIDDIAFIHGHYSGMGKHRDYMRMNVVHGHDHQQYIVTKPVWDTNMQHKTIWEMSCGLLGDPFSAALSYRSQRIHNWVTGVGMIDSLGPRLISF